MGYHAVRVEEPVLRGLAANLPLGKVYASGKAFVPFTKAEIFDRLATLIDGKPAAAELASKANAAPEPTPSAQSDKPSMRFRPRDWSEIGGGSLVLAHDGEGWFEALVILPLGDSFRLRWRDYPKEPPVVRRRDELALLYPEVAQSH